MIKKPKTSTKQLIGELKQKQKYSNAIEKQSIKSTTAAVVGMNGSENLAIKRDVSVKHLVSITSDDAQSHAC